MTFNPFNLYKIQRTEAPSSLAWLSRFGTFRLFGYESLSITEADQRVFGRLHTSVEVVTEPYAESHDNELHQCALVVFVVHSMESFHISFNYK